MPYTDPTPKPSAMTPNSESRTGATGGNAAYARDDHQHPRLTSVTSGVLDANGLSGAMNFTRSFASKPGIACTADVPGGTQPVVFEVASWIIDVGGNYVGCTIRGYRAGATTLAAVTVVGVSVAVGAQTVTPFSNAGAAGVNFSLIAVQVS